MKAVHAFVQTCNPDLIINAAAHTAVDLCESDKENAYAINANGPKYLAMAAKEIDAELVHVSTDYVFDGTSSRPYLETDTPCPQSVYGSSKLAGEKNVMESMKKYYIVRTAWLYGDGKNFVRTMLRLAKDHDMLTVVNDQFGSPTSALELARMILYIIDKKTTAFTMPLVKELQAGMILQERSLSRLLFPFKSNRFQPKSIRQRLPKDLPIRYWKMHIFMHLVITG